MKIGALPLGRGCAVERWRWVERRQAQPVLSRAARHVAIKAFISSAE